MTGQYASEYGFLDFIASPATVFDPNNQLGLEPGTVSPSLKYFFH